MSEDFRLTEQQQVPRLRCAALGMTLLITTLFGSMAVAQQDRTAELREMARVATVMVDGDVCQRIVTPRAMKYLLHPDPRDVWSDGDNYDVDDAAFEATKKTLMRVALLEPYPVDVNLWMPLPAASSQGAGKILMVVRQHDNLSQFWNGELMQAMPAAFGPVLTEGRTATVADKRGMVSVLAPVRNSLGRVVGLVEVVTSASPAEHDER